MTQTQNTIQQCDNCHVQELCLPTALDGDGINLMNNVVNRRFILAKGDHLYRVGNAFHGIYAIKHGALKSSCVTADGREQVTGFYLEGELVGLDAVDEDMHPYDAVALMPTEVCQLSFNALTEASGKAPNLLRALIRVMAREIRREEQVVMLLGSATAEQRVARFFINLYERLEKRGAEHNIITLVMSRQDIGNYLGLAIETVSRQFRKLQDQGIVLIDKRNIEVLDMQILRQVSASIM